jgi:hypothetical protein
MHSRRWAASLPPAPCTLPPLASTSSPFVTPRLTEPSPEGQDEPNSVALRALPVKLATSGCGAFQRRAPCVDTSRPRLRVSQKNQPCRVASIKQPDVGADLWSRRADTGCSLLVPPSPPVCVSVSEGAADLSPQESHTTHRRWQRVRKAQELPCGARAPGAYRAKDGTEARLGLRLRCLRHSSRRCRKGKREGDSEALCHHRPHALVGCAVCRAQVRVQECGRAGAGALGRDETYGRDAGILCLQEYATLTPARSSPCAHRTMRRTLAFTALLAMSVSCSGPDGTGFKHHAAARQPDASHP